MQDAVAISEMTDSQRRSLVIDSQETKDQKVMYERSGMW